MKKAMTEKMMGIIPMQVQLKEGLKGQNGPPYHFIEESTVNCGVAY